MDYNKQIAELEKKIQDLRLEKEREEYIEATANAILVLQSSIIVVKRGGSLESEKEIVKRALIKLHAHADLC